MTLSVLVVDDDRQMRWLIRELCGEIGVTAVEAENGEEGERKFRENPNILLIVTDERMPKMTGRELLSRTLGELRQRGGCAALVTDLPTAAIRLDCYMNGVPVIDKMSLCTQVREFLATFLASVGALREELA